MKKFGKLMAKNFTFIIGLYLFAMAVCGTGLVINNAPTSNASNGEAPTVIANPAVSITLWTIMAILSVAVTAVIVMVLVARKEKAKSTSVINKDNPTQ